MGYKIGDMKELVILRGLPGSGKSTIANIITGGRTDWVCSNDEYFEHDGKYEWKAEELGKAKEHCANKCRLLMNADVPVIVIANVNPKYKSFANYVDMAKQFGYRVHVMTVEHHHNGKNVHGVSPEVIGGMAMSFELKL